jgi:CheY-like chemotaxis protein
MLAIFRGPRMIDSFVKVVEAIAHLIAAIAWPVVIVLALRWFGPTLRSLFDDKSDVSLTGWGWAITAKRESREAIALAEVSKADDKAEPRQLANLKDGLGKSFAATKWIQQLNISETIGKSILWVDDQPGNNTFEREAFEALGMKVHFVPATAQALQLIKGNEYDVVISDMSRPEGQRAGYDLLAKIKMLRPTMPFILYSSSNTPEQEAEIKSAGAFGSTARASDLIRLVTDAIKRREPNARLEAAYLQRLRNLMAHRVTKS